MPPESSQLAKASSQTSSLVGALSNAVKKFCEEVAKEKRVKGPIKTPEALNALRESLRGQRKGRTKVSKAIISSLANQLDNEGSSLCSRLDPQIFSTVVEVILQAEGCRDGERGIHLLAASLHQDSRQTTNQRRLEKRKDMIGKECFQLLLSYLLDTENDVGTRRWVGILCGQLLNGSEENYDKLELGPDEIRRRIGPLLIEERNELIRVICGQLVRDLKKAGVPLKELFPINYDSKLYDSFPEATQGDRGWGLLFDHYVDDVVVATNQPPTIGELHFASGFSLAPPYPFGVKDRNVYILVIGQEMSILAPPSEANMEQILDVPLQSIQRMTIILQAHSQNKGFADVILELENNKDVFCHLDTVATKVSRIYMSSEMGSIKAMKGLFRECCPDLDVIEEHKDQAFEEETLEDNDENLRSTLNSRAEEAFGRRSYQAERGQQSSTSQEPIFCDRDDDQIDQMISGATSKTIPELQTQPNEARNPQQVSQDEGMDILHHNNKDSAYDASLPAGESAQTSKRSKTLEDNRSVAKTGRSSNRRKAIKPKAKPPIIASQRHVNFNEPAGQSFTSPASPRRQMNPGESYSLHAAKKAISSKYLPKKPTSSLPHPWTKTTAVEDGIESFQQMQKAKSSKSGRPSAKFHPEVSQLKQSGNFGDDDSITTPDINDASAPKVKADKPLKRAAAETANDIKSRSRQLKDELSAASPKKGKRYGLHSNRMAKSGDVFEIPDDQDTDAPTQASKTKVKSRNSTGTINSEGGPNAAKLYGRKKRQSAPAKLKKSIAPTRSSQRVAAAEANARIRGADDSEDEIEVEHDESKAPKAPKNLKNKVIISTKVCEDQQNAPKLRAKAEAIQTQPLNSPAEVLFQMQQADAVNLSIGDHAEVKGAPLVLEPPPELTISMERKSARDGSKANNSVIDMANKLDSLLDLREGDIYQERPSPEAVKPEKLTTNSASQQVSMPCQGPTVELTSSSPAKSEHVVEIMNPESLEKPVRESQIQVLERVAVEPEDRLNTAYEGGTYNERKRKPTGEDAISSKRRQNTNHDKEHSRPLLLAKSQRDSPSKKSKTISPALARKSPKLGHSITNSADRAFDPPLVDEHLARKQQMISFDAQGPRNQGLLSMDKRSIKQPSGFEIPEENHSIEDQSVHLKRKRGKPEAADAQSSENSPPKKRPSVSPSSVYGESENGEAGERLFNSSPPSPVAEPTPLPARVKRQSSQASRVDVNGSPMASPSVPKVDHFGKLKKKLSGKIQIDIQALQVDSQGDKSERSARRLSEVFGPKIKLSSQPKACPSSSCEIVDRYVAHKKTDNGQYEEISTKEVVAVQKALADPFLEEGRKPSNFTERLQNNNGAKYPKSQRHPKEIPQPEILEAVVIDDVNLPTHPRESAAVHSEVVHNRHTRKTTHRVSLVDEDRTLVNEKSRHIYEQPIPSDMTSGSTNESSQSSRTPLDERLPPNKVWNVAFRPHYTSLSNAAHRIADEVIIQLAGEEDRMGLLVENYDEKGNKVLGSFESKREEEKKTILKQLERKKTEMLSMYNDAKEFVQETAVEYMEISVSEFEKDWRKQQSATQKKMSEGMYLLG